MAAVSHSIALRGARCRRLTAATSTATVGSYAMEYSRHAGAAISRSATCATSWIDTSAAGALSCPWASRSTPQRGRADGPEHIDRDRPVGTGGDRRADLGGDALRRSGPDTDVKWDTGILLIRRSHTLGSEVMPFTKTAKDQRLYMPEPLVEVLRWHVNEDIPPRFARPPPPQRRGGIRGGERWNPNILDAQILRDEIAFLGGRYACLEGRICSALSPSDWPGPPATSGRERSRRARAVEGRPAAPPLRRVK